MLAKLTLQRLERLAQQLCDCRIKSDLTITFALGAYAGTILQKNCWPVHVASASGRMNTLCKEERSAKMEKGQVYER